MSSNFKKPATLKLRELELDMQFEDLAREKTRAGWTDSEIADLLGVTRQTYRMWRKAAGLKPQRELVAASSAS